VKKQHDPFEFEPTQPPFKPIKRYEKMDLYQARLQVLGQILPEICHQVSNCLCTVIVFLDNLLMEEKDPKEIQTYQLLRSFCKNNVEMTRKVQIFGNPDTSGSKLIDIKDLLTELVGFLKLSSPDIKVELDLQEKSVVFADSVNIYLAVWNLMVNAKDAVRSNKEKLIKITVRQAEFTEPLQFGKCVCLAGNYVIISVWDNGHGIDEEDIDNIFRPYYSKKSEGMGLGLKIVQDIAEKYRGCVNVISTEDQGTTFDLYLPARAD